MRQWLLALFLPFCLHAGGWDPVPPEIWAIKADSTKSSSGAIYLLDWSRYGVNDTEYRLRVLILSEAGKAAVQLDPFSAQDKVEGRVLYPDGKQTEFSKTEDFSNQIIKVGSNDLTRKVVVPPGLTDHCIVDISLTENWSHLRGTRFDRWIQRAYPIKDFELRLTLLSRLASAWIRPNSMPMVSKLEDGYVVYKLKDLPALEVEPYSREAWLNRPKLVCFDQPFVLRESAVKTPNAYWDTVASKIVKPIYIDEMKVGRKFWALDQTIIADLPKDPIQKAQAIIDRLYARILNVSALTAAERVARSKRDEKATIDPIDLNETADRGWTNGTGMFYMACKIFMSAELSPKFLYVANRDQRGFRQELPDFYQFDDVLVGVDSADGKTTTWFDPSARYIPLGVISPDFQGTQAIFFDSKGWTAHSYQVPMQPADMNRLEFRYEVVPGEDSDAFNVKAQFSGFDEWVERGKYFGLTPADAEKHLKDEMEASKVYTVTRAVITNGAERGKAFSWEVEGSRESEGGHRREVNPFPDMLCPLWIPSTWPEHRVDPVVMSYASIHRATSRVRIPNGWKAVLPDALEKSNRFGKASWQATEIQDEKGKAVLVSYDVIVSSQMGEAASEGDLRDLLSWVQDAWNRRIGLEKVP